MDWLHCNKCYTLRSDGPFWFTSCGHIICSGCVKHGSMLPNQKAPCIICQNRASILEINRSMRPDLMSLFRSPKDLLMEYATKVKSVFDFQNSQREDLVKYLQNRYAKAGKFVQHAKLEIAKRDAHEKQLLVERSQTKAELEESKKYIEQLEKKLADRKQEIQNLKHHQPRKANQRAGNRDHFPNLNGHTPIDMLSFFGCATSTPIDLMGNIAAHTHHQNRDAEVNADYFDMFCSQNAYEDSPLAGGPNPNRFPSTPQLLGSKMRTSEANKTKKYF